MYKEIPKKLNFSTQNVQHDNYDCNWILLLPDNNITRQGDILAFSQNFLPKKSHVSLVILQEHMDK